jgi:prevent-host-death family protein
MYQARCGMSRIIGVTDLQRKFRPIFDEVAYQGRSYILTRGSRPEAAMIPYEAFLRFQQLQEKQVLDRFDRLLARMSQLNAAYSDAEIQADLEAAEADPEAVR